MYHPMYHPMHHRIAPLLLVLLTLSAHADEAAIRKNLAERFPNAPKIVAVNPTQLPGIFEVYTDNRLLYTDANGDYLMMGALMDTRARVNLSQQRLLELKAVKFEKLPFEHAIKLVKGKGERQIAVFSDPDCPHCKALEKELAKLDNLTVHLFLMPLADLHPQAVGIAEAIWCAEDRARSWQAYMLENVKPEAGKACATPLSDIAKLAADMNINGTPAIILPNGRILPGAVTSGQLETLLGKS
jgi:thiol:disulfide interchange protein DsbC